MDGSVNFNRTQDDHKHGFSNLVGEFWPPDPKQDKKKKQPKKEKKKSLKSLKLLLFSEYIYF